jgi:hypothetical protein
VLTNIHMFASTHTHSQQTSELFVLKKRIEIVQLQSNNRKPPYENGSGHGHHRLYLNARENRDAWGNCLLTVNAMEWPPGRRGRTAKTRSAATVAGKDADEENDSLLPSPIPSARRSSQYARRSSGQRGTAVQGGGRS